LIQRRVLVSGRVQGVGFRAALTQQASSVSGLRGFVRNLKDGRVEALFQGEDRQVLSLLAWCRKGPAAAQVTRLEVIEEPIDPQLAPFGIASTP
jgi:acylphosphatase